MSRSRGTEDPRELLLELISGPHPREFNSVVGGPVFITHAPGGSMSKRFPCVKNPTSSVGMTRTGIEAEGTAQGKAQSCGHCEWEAE